MTLWRAVTYRLFAGAGDPARSVRVRAVLFTSGVLLCAYLAYRFTPPLFAGVTAIPHFLALAYVFSTAGIMAIALCTDAYQRSFLAKLHNMNQLPLHANVIRSLYMYASAPLGIVATVVITASLAGAAGSGISPLLVVVSGLAGCIGAVLTDILLRITQKGSLIGSVIRIGIIGISLYLLRLLLQAATVTVNDLLPAGCAALQLMVTIWLTRRPVITQYALAHAPIAEGRPGILSALPLRALRTTRYAGTNLVLAVLMTIVFMTARSEVPIVPLDGVVLISLLLIGTLGQEARALSAIRYPIELTLYGTIGRWLAGGWLLAGVHGLLWIDVCLGIVHVFSPYGLAIGYAQVGFVGFTCIAAGILAGSLAVPDRQDILAQCGSTVVYGVLVWAVLKIPTTTFGARVPSVIVAVSICVSCLLLAYICERRRWRRTIGVRRAAA